MTNDRLFTFRDHTSFSVGYDDPDETPGNMGGWFLTLSTQGKTVEHSVPEHVAKEIIEEHDLEEKEDDS